MSDLWTCTSEFSAMNQLRAKHFWTLLALVLIPVTFVWFGKFARSGSGATFIPEPLSDQYTHGEHSTVLPTPSRSPANMNLTYDVLSRRYQEGTLDFSLVDAYEVPQESLSEMELEILKDEPLNDITSVANQTMSVMQVVGPVSKGKYKQGDVLTVLVVVRDSKGRPVTKGGHSIRVWMADEARGLSAAALVTDLRNGSYVARFPVLWAGRATVFAALMESRAYRRLLLHELNTRKATQSVFAGFVKGNSSETTFCLPHPVIPSSPEVCNLTSLNDGLPWYCGRPANHDLSCDDWFVTRCPYGGERHYPATESERQLLARLKQDQTAGGRIFRMRHTVDIMAEDGTVRNNAQPCHLQPPRETWNDRSPNGFWHRKTWNHLTCKVPDTTTRFFETCFRNKTFFMLGDSNARAIFQIVAGMSRCTFSWASHPSYLPVHVPVYCDNEKLGFHQEWNPHAHPFHNVDEWSFRPVKHAVSFHLAKIPSKGSYVILIHLYIHYYFYHSHLLLLHVRDAVHGVRDLLARNSAAKVVVRGPHAWLPETGDFHGLRVRRILREEFRALGDRVVYLDFWDMTVANANAEPHPEHDVVYTMTRIFLGHVCS